ncbi:hypothetical protein HDU97_001700 [Phlyctochytrium planicorne]|nr:hypothetical protein HDU97_001700 [Phlyctochytrium planicorne]
MAPIGILILFGLISLGSSQSIPEPCTKLLPSANNGVLASGDILESCYAAIPFNASARADYVSIAKTSLQFHAALPYVKQKYPDVDPLKDMTTIINDPAVTSRMEVANRLRDWRNNNFDKTLVSFVDSCFMVMQTFQPFAIALPVGTASGLPVIVDVVKGFLGVKDEAYLSGFWKSKSNLDIYKYKGYQVKSINGQDPYVLAKSILFDLDDAVSSAFTSYYVDNRRWSALTGHFSRHYGPFSTGFFSQPVTYQLQGPSGDSVTLADIPWAVLPNYHRTDDPDEADATWSTDFQISLEVLGRRCFGIRTTLSGSASGDIKIDASTTRHSASGRFVRRDVSVPIPAEGSKSPLIRVDDNTFAFTMSDNAQYLNDNQLTPEFQVSSVAKAAFKELDAKFAEAKKSASRLIIDITNGDFGCEGQILLKYLFGVGKPIELNLLLSPEVKEAISVAPTSESDYLEPFLTNNMASVSALNILTNTASPNLPGSPTFSGRFTRTVCSKYESQILPSMNQLQGGWNPSNVILVSNELGIKSYVYGYNVSTVNVKFDKGFRFITPTRLFPMLRGSPLFDSVKTADGSVLVAVPVYNMFDSAAPADAAPLYFVDVEPDVRLNAHSGDYPLGVWKAAATIMPAATPPSPAKSSDATVPGLGSALAMGFLSLLLL